MNEHMRQTGRTTRMLVEACKLAWEGRAVYILTRNEEQRRWMEHRLTEIWSAAYPGPHNHGIKVETPQTLGYFDWSTRTGPGNPHPNCRFLMDHMFVEQRIESLHWQIKELTDEIKDLYPLTI